MTVTMYWVSIPNRRVKYSKEQKGGIRNILLKGT